LRNSLYEEKTYIIGHCLDGILATGDVYANGSPCDRIAQCIDQTAVDLKSSCENALKEMTKDARNNLKNLLIYIVFGELDAKGT
jgi:hypothetical protein